MQTKHNKYVVNQKREHFDDISVSELFGRTRVIFFVVFCLQNKICPFLRQCICIYVDQGQSQRAKNKIFTTFY